MSYETIKRIVRSKEDIAKMIKDILWERYGGSFKNFTWNTLKRYRREVKVKEPSEFPVLAIATMEEVDGGLMGDYMLIEVSYKVKLELEKEIEELNKWINQF